VKELFDLAFSPANLFLTVMSLLMLLYWVLVIFGAADPDYFSIDFDVDSDFDLPIQGPDIEHASHRGGAGDNDGEGIWIDTLRFFHFDELPLMLIFTLNFFTMWLISINVTHYFGISNPLIAMLLYIPYFLVSLFVVKIFSKPLIWLYSRLNHKGEEAIDFLGRRCVVINDVKPDAAGMVELLVKGDPIKLYAKSNTPETIPAGSEAVIINESSDKKFYFIEKFDY
jgi:hypothetical protein